jgi:nicotinate-nucleotide pyrophosphorylase (carboxylating)
MHSANLKAKLFSEADNQNACGAQKIDGDHLKAIALDIPSILLGCAGDRWVRAAIASSESAVVAGTAELERKAKAAGLAVEIHVSAGMQVNAGCKVATVTGRPLQIVQGEDCLLSVIGKASGVATAAREAVRKAGRIRVVCGGWKKIPSAVKSNLRSAVGVGGAGIRILAEPFVYLDKNYIRILGSLSEALMAARSIPGRAIVAQLRGETGLIEKEALTAAGLGARVVMVDTGRIDDVRAVSNALQRKGLRRQVQIAFAGGVQLGDLEGLQREDIDIVDIGRAILDAPLVDFRYDVVETRSDNNGWRSL